MIVCELASSGVHFVEAQTSKQVETFFVEMLKTQISALQYFIKNILY